MQRIKYTLVLLALAFVSSLSYGQDEGFSNHIFVSLYKDNSNRFVDRLEHKIVAGFNLGASAPLPIPAEVRSIDAWWPQFTPQLGYNILYKATDRWGIGSGILLNYKGMGVKDKVKYMYTEVVIEEGGSDKLSGYFVGKNETRVKAAYVTIPLFISYSPNSNWSFRAGGYASYLFSGQFMGTVSDGYLREVTPLGTKTEITQADFDFNDDLKSLDFGASIGAERRINNRFGIYANLDWGLTPIFPSDFRAMKFDLYNIYLTLGLSYKL
ncbi:PorT family protein [Bacteroidales bacterium OttesenSCG-928-J19]|nr:PorT family protein [Bacteroidales bacterium OttesenSCG-928-J19]